MKTNNPITVLAILLLAALTARADVIPGRWEIVDGLKPGTPIIVKLKAGDRMEGILKGSSPANLTFIDVTGNEVKLTETEILRVESAEKTKDSLKNGALIGAGLGAAGGFAALYGFANQVTSSGPIWDAESAGFFIAAALAGAGIGALAGLAVDASIKGKKVLYKAR